MIEGSCPARCENGGTSKHDQCKAKPKLAIANAMAWMTRSAAINPSRPAATIQKLAFSLKLMFSVTSAFANRISFCTSSDRSPSTSLSVRTKPVLPKDSYAMEVTRIGAEALSPARTELAAAIARR